MSNRIVDDETRRRWHDGWRSEVQPLVDSGRLSVEDADAFADLHTLIDVEAALARVIRQLEAGHHHPIGWMYCASQQEIDYYNDAQREAREAREACALFAERARKIEGFLRGA